jgi:hypothetical protein
MTNAQKNCRTISQFLEQHCDGFLLVAFNPTDQEPITCVSVADGKSETAINAIVGGILSAGGVGALKAAIKEKEKEGED